MLHRVPSLARLKAVAAHSDLWLGYVVRIWGQFTFFCFFMYAGRLLAPEAFGVYALAALFALFFQIFLYAGPYNYIISVTDVDEAKPETLTVQIAIAAIASVVLVGVALFADQLFHGRGLKLLILSFLPSIWLSSWVAWMEAFLLRWKMLRRYYISIALAETLGAIIGIISLQMGAGVYSLVIHRYVGIVIWALIYSSTPVPMCWPRLRLDQLKRVMIYSYGMYGNSLGTFVANYIADLMIGIYMTPAAVGFYRMSSRIVAAVTDIAGQPARTIGWSLMSNVQRREGNLAKIWPPFLALFLAITASGLLSLAVIAPDAVEVLLGPSWASIPSIIVVLCFVRLLSSFEIVAVPVLGAQHRTQLALALRMVELSLIVFFVFVFAKYGPVAAAWAQLPAGIVLAIGSIWVLVWRSGVRASNVLEPLSRGLVVIFATVATFVAVRSGLYRLTQETLLVLVLSCLCGGVVWLLTMKVFAWENLVKPVIEAWRLPHTDEGISSESMGSMTSEEGV